MSRQSRLENLEKRRPDIDRVTRIERPIKELDGTVTEKYVRIKDADGNWNNHFEKLIDGYWIKID